MDHAVAHVWIFQRGQQSALAREIILAVADELARALGVAEGVDPGQRSGIRIEAHRASSSRPRTTASAMRATRAICRTSWTRTMSAPCAIQSAMVAAVPSA